MPTSGPARRAATAAALTLLAALTLTACGDLHASGGTGGSATPGTSDGTGESAVPGTPDRAGGSAVPSASGTSPSPSSSRSAAGPSPYVEPGAGDGAPHHDENNAHRRPRAMSAAHAEDAAREADRVRPVLRRLWERRTWDPGTVRTALLRLGYEEERVAADGTRLGGTLTVTTLPSDYENGAYVTPEGAMAGLRVHDDACVTAVLQPANFRVEVHGPYLETGCFAPPTGH
ncbi:hypothetical protein ABZY20_08320 [Streptomyces sp. NPDC006624]|uniref:hypothetical protein n=1 Tax=Streptomyces sp. NPDC006624 TaxID=3154892 RepID=UPI0033BCA2FD